MARNASGTYARVVDAYVDGGVIRADDHNDEHDDFGAEITDSLNRSGKGGMLAGLKLINGLVGAPAFYFAGGTTTGMYLNAAGDLRLALTAADIQKWTAALVRIETALTVTGATTLGSTTVGGTLDVTGNTTLGGTLTATAAATTLATLTVNGATTVDGALGVTGNTTLGGVVAAWVQSTPYVIGNQVIANGNIYVCDTNGTSAGSGTGPTGTGANITDGTTQWDFVSAAATLAVAGVATFRSQASFIFGADMTNDKIVNVATGTNGGDAVNLSQMNAAIAIETARGHAVLSYGASDTDLGPSSTKYLNLGWSAANANEESFWVATEDGTLQYLRIYAKNAASGGTSTVFTIRRNGSDTAVAATLGSGSNTASELVQTQQIVAGDRISLRAVAGAGATAPGLVSVGLRFTAA